MTLGFFFPCPSESRVEACLTAMLHFSRSLAIMTISWSLHPRRWEESHECFCRRLCWSQQVLKVNKTFRGRNFLIKFLHHPLIAYIFPLLHIFSLGLHPLDSFRRKIKWSQHFLWVIKLNRSSAWLPRWACLPESHLEVAPLPAAMFRFGPVFHQPSECVVMTTHLRMWPLLFFRSPCPRDSVETLLLAYSQFSWRPLHLSCGFAQSMRMKYSLTCNMKEKKKQKLRKSMSKITKV